MTHATDHSSSASSLAVYEKTFSTHAVSYKYSFTGVTGRIWIAAISDFSAPQNLPSMSNCKYKVITYNQAPDCQSSTFPIVISCLNPASGYGWSLPLLSALGYRCQYTCAACCSFANKSRAKFCRSVFPITSAHNITP